MSWTPKGKLSRRDKARGLGRFMILAKVSVRCPGMKREAGKRGEHVWNMRSAFSSAVKVDQFQALRELSFQEALDIDLPSQEPALRLEGLAPI
jgi:hypothetical protein